jgi:hypothetical protein
LYAGDFYSARDFFYLSAILLGAAIGFFFSFYKKGLRYGQKENRVTAGFWLLPAAILAAFAAFILSGGDVLQERGILIMATCMMAAGGLAVLLPETFLFPVIVVSGVCVVFGAHIFLRYPQIYSRIPVTRIELGAADTILIEPEYPKFMLANKNLFAGNEARIRYKNYYDKSHPFTLEYTAVIVTINRIVPLIGGQRRCILTGLNLVDYRRLRLRLYFPSFPEDALMNSLLLYDGSLVSTQNFFNQIELNNLELHTEYTIYFDGRNLSSSVRNRFGHTGGPVQRVIWRQGSEVKE